MPSPSPHDSLAAEWPWPGLMEVPPNGVCASIFSKEAKRQQSEQEGKERPVLQWNNTGFISCSSPGQSLSHRAHGSKG